MKKMRILLAILALSVTGFAALKVLHGHPMYSGGIGISSLLFLITLSYWFIRISWKKQRS
ncbi:hypothetical protein [Cyclobacterium xiamenense]|nr:hypothetical protein [Cyclobacterium xiamenense]